MLVAQEGIFVAGEGIIGRRDGNAHIDAYHASVGQQLELAGIAAALSEDGGAVGERVGIHKSQTFIEVLDSLDAEHRTKDLAVANGHSGLHMVEDRGAKEEAILVSGDHNTTTIQYQYRVFLNALLNPAADFLLVSRRYYGPQIRFRIIGAANYQLLSFFLIRSTN